MRNGSSGYIGVPSGTANKSPVNRSPANISKKPSGVCKLRRGPKISYLFGLESQIQQVLDRLCQPCGQEKCPIRRQPANVQLKGGPVAGLGNLEISSRHGELV